jgi:hypothetical protein
MPSFGILAAGLLAALLTLFHALPLAAAERVALVIGNSAYKSAPALKNPRNDAEDLAAALARLGFQVLKGTDVDQYNLKALVRSFSHEIETASIAVFFYAGHGLQVNGKNYMIPVDASFEKEADLDFEAIDVNFVLRQLERKDRTNIVFLDACRNNPFTTRLVSTMGQRSVFVGRGLARVETGVGTFIGFATQPDAIAHDGEGKNSPFTAALLKYIEEPGLDIELLMRRVREDVIAATQGKQVPWSNSSLVGDKVVLKAAPEASDTEPGTSIAVPPAPPPDTANAREIELAYWNSVKDSGNPAFLKAYLDTYPKGSFANLARAMIVELEGKDRAKAEPQSKEEPLAKLAPAESAPAVEEPKEAPKTVPLIEKKPAVVLAPPAEAQPRPRKAPIILKKKVAQPPVVAPRVREKVKTRVKAAISEPVGEQCGFCFACLAEGPVCPRQWVCGAKFRARQADGLCAFRR